jgi:hypothetical protein
MKLIIPSVAAFLYTVNGESNSASQVAANYEEAQQVLFDYCAEKDPNTGEFINSEDTVCQALMEGKSSGPGPRKLKQLKMLVLWLQPEHRFARYCYYGCWCLPDADHADFTPRYGKPVDEVDQSCKRMSQCYDCAKYDHGEDCESSDTGYKFELHKDNSDPNNHWKNSIVCTDDPKKKGCRRSVCECDKRLAEDLRTNFGFWVQGHHQTQGGFDTSMCEVEHCTSGNCQSRGPVECCGAFDGPRYPFRTNGGQRKCCGNKTYDSTIQECCSDGDVRFSGAC